MFRFVSYSYLDNEAVFRYQDDRREYVERVKFTPGESAPDPELLDRALFLAFMVVGTSYYKVSPTRAVSIEQGDIDSWQAEFFDKVYQEGMSQFAYENNLERSDLAKFEVTNESSHQPVRYEGNGILSMQSGGKDSLLVTTMLEERGRLYAPWYCSSSDSHPSVLGRLSSGLVTARRSIDRDALRVAAERGGMNGHVPVTYIMLSFALIQALMLGKNTILSAIGNEGVEPHAWIGDLAVNHQWSKTWEAEQLFAEYVKKHISADIRVGSPLRSFSELKIAKLFAEQSWGDFGEWFSSCNLGNYMQGADNSTLSWCGICPKCANSYLLFAPFIQQTELQQRLGGDLFATTELVDTFKGLLGIDGVMKPFECVGEVEELRQAYQMALSRGYTKLPFDVPESSFDIDTNYPAQAWATELLV